MSKSTNRDEDDAIGRVFYDRAGKHDYSCRDVGTLVQLVKRLHKGPFRELWYRGHAQHTWHLVPSIFRRPDAVAEPNIIEAFQRAAPVRYANCPHPDDRLAWLQLMQHYRLPTRLLDWSESPLVALFFATDTLDDSDGDLWVLDPWRLNAAQRSRRGAASESEEQLGDPAFDPAARKPKAQALGFHAQQHDHRMALQQAAFTIHSDRTPLERVAPRMPWLGRVRVPKSSKRAIRQQLQSLGIRRSSLFLDLENLAADLSGQRWKTFDLGGAKLRMKPGS